VKCVICRSTAIEKKIVEEEIKAGNDIVLVPLELIVCQNCGERYYDKISMLKLEKVREKIREGKISLRTVGKVMKAEAA